MFVRSICHSQTTFTSLQFLSFRMWRGKKNKEKKKNPELPLRVDPKSTFKQTICSANMLSEP